MNIFLKHLMLIFLLILLTYSCSNNQTETTHKTDISSKNNESAKLDKENSLPYELVYKTSSEKHYVPTEIIFEANFNNDTITFYKKDKKLFEENLTTDHTIGLANTRKTTVKPSDSIYVQFNRSFKIKLDSIGLFPYLFISKKSKGDNITLEFSTKRRYYK